MSVFKVVPLQLRRYGIGGGSVGWYGSDGGCRMTVVPVSTSPRSVEENDQGTLRDACISLVVALFMSLVTFCVLGLALHLLDSRYFFSPDRAIQQPWAWLSILDLSVIWLISGLFLQMRAGRGSTDCELAASAGETNNKDSVVIGQKQRQGRPSSRRPNANGEAAGWAAAGAKPSNSNDTITNARL